MVGLVQWYYFSSFRMESGSANLEIQPALMKCEWFYHFFYHLVPNTATRDFQTHDLERNSIGSFVLMEILKDLANVNPG